MLFYIFQWYRIARVVHVKSGTLLCLRRKWGKRKIFWRDDGSSDESIKRWSSRPLRLRAACFCFFSHASDCFFVVHQHPRKDHHHKMRPTFACLSKAPRRPLTPKRGNKDYYKGVYRTISWVPKWEWSWRGAFVTLRDTPGLPSWWTTHGCSRKILWEVKGIVQTRRWTGTILRCSTNWRD